MCMSCSPVLSSRWAAAGRQKVSRHNGLDSTRISMSTSQRAWRRAALSRSVSCSGLMLPCSHTSKRTRTAAPAHRCPRAHTHLTHRYRKHCAFAKASQPELWLPESTWTTVVRVSNRSGWREMLETSPLRAGPLPSWAGTCSAQPLASTNDSAMQAIPEESSTLTGLEERVMEKRTKRARQNCMNDANTHESNKFSWSWKTRDARSYVSLQTKTLLYSRAWFY